MGFFKEPGVSKECPNYTAHFLKKDKIKEIVERHNGRANVITRNRLLLAVVLSSAGR